MYAPLAHSNLIMREEDRFDLKGERRRTEGRKRETKTKERKKVSLLRKREKRTLTMITTYTYILLHAQRLYISAVVHQYFVGV